MKNENLLTYPIKQFIQELHVEEKKAHDYPTLVENIHTSYANKSKASETYFIKNIAHIYNTKTQKPLMNFSTMELDKNYSSSIDPKIAKLMSQCDNNNEVINLSNKLVNYTHVGNTEFLEARDHTYAHIKLAKVKYIDYKNQDKVPVMLTMTLDRIFRKYIKQDKNAILGEFKGLQEINKDANLQESIEASYRHLNTVFRDFYHYLKNLNKRAKESQLDYVMIFEPHKSLTLHLHILFYNNDKQLINLKRAWERYLKKLTPKQKLAQDYKEIDTNRAKGSTYLAKYLVKEYNTEENGSSFFNRFRRFFSKFKLFRTSNFVHTTQKNIDRMYGYLRMNYPDILYSIRLSDTPLYIVLEEMQVQGLFQFEISKNKVERVDRKLIKEFYEKRKHTQEDYKIKQQIVDTIENFTKIVQMSKMETAVFLPSDKTIEFIFDTYQIDRSELIGLENNVDVFYENGMYEIENMKLNDAINLSFLKVIKCG